MSFVMIDNEDGSSSLDLCRTDEAAEEQEGRLSQIRGEEIKDLRGCSVILLTPAASPT